MKNRLIICLIICSVIVWTIVSLASLVKAEELLRIVALRISPSDSSAIVYWTTNYPTSGYFQFGLTNGFGNWLEDKNFNTYHETGLNGLLPEKTYYLKLKATNVSGRIVESDIYSFKTLKEDDKNPPAVTLVHTSFVTGNTATFVWQTDKPSDSCVYYDTKQTDMKKKVCSSTRVKIHDLTVNNLVRNRLYYYQVSSKDQAGNVQYSVTYNFQTNFDADTNAPELIIYDISPFNRRGANNMDEATISLVTNRPVEGTLKYGEKSGQYPNKINLPSPRDTAPKIALTNLKPDQTYYYRLSLKDVLGKKLDTPEFSFKTLPKNILTALPTEDIFNISDPRQDFDRDGLTNIQEGQYGTDPLKPDTDADGYLDGIEMQYGYNPLGPGRLEKPLENFAYGQPRLKSLAAEQQLAQELRQQLEQYFKKQIPKSTQSWYSLVNAYIYGGYPIEAIAQAIKWGGKTVHPIIPWNAWQNTPDYQNYINK